MATINATATASPSSMTLNGTTAVNGTISWTKPTLPTGAVITSCVLTGTATISMSKGKGTCTINNTSVTGSFSINLGTSNSTTSVTVKGAGGNKNSSGTIKFSNLQYTVTYTIKYTVTFVDWNGTVLKTQQVDSGSAATAPSNPTRNGYRFTGWDVAFNNITGDLTVYAQYVEIIYFTVTFVDWNGTVLKTQQVENGLDATAPSNPTRDGYVFTGWSGSFNSVMSNLTITAQYEKKDESEEPGEPDDTLTNIFPPFNDEKWSLENSFVQIHSATETTIDFDVYGLAGAYHSLDQKDVGGKTIRFGMDMTKSSENAEMVIKHSNNNEEIAIVNYENPVVEVNIPSSGTFSILIHSNTANYNSVYIENPYLYILGDFEEPDNNVIEWTGIGTVAENIYTMNEWTYKLNIDWDNQCLEVDLTFEVGIFLPICALAIWKQNSTSTYGDCLIELDDEGYFTRAGSFINDEYSYMPFGGDRVKLRFSKENKIEFIYNNEIIGSFYDGDITNESVIYLSSLDRNGASITEAIGSPDRSTTIHSIKVLDLNSSGDDGFIEWTGIGTVATNLRAFKDHNSYKINLDWENESFDLVITGELNRNGNYMMNIGYISEIKIGENIIGIHFEDGTIGIDNDMDNIDYYYHENGAFPFTISFTKDGIYVKSYDILTEIETDPILLSGSENVYDINQPIYIIDDRLPNVVINDAYENPIYDITFDLVVSEYSSGNDNDLIQGDIVEDGTFDDESPTVVRTKYIDISDKKSIRVSVLTDNVYISACYLYNANKELVKIIEIPEDKKRMFGINLQQLINQILEEEEGGK